MERKVALTECQHTGLHDYLCNNFWAQLTGYGTGSHTSYSLDEVLCDFPAFQNEDSAEKVTIHGVEEIYEKSYIVLITITQQQI